LSNAAAAARELATPIKCQSSPYISLLKKRSSDAVTKEEKKMSTVYKNCIKL